MCNNHGMSAPKNKGGRPRRVAGQTLERLSLSLRPAMRLGLELLARQRKVSLSQACEYALAVALRDTSVGGQSAYFLAEQYAQAEEIYRRHPMLLMPDTLLTPEELFARDIFHAISDRAETLLSSLHGAWLSLYMEEILETATNAFRTGQGEHEVIDHLITVTGLRSGGLEATRRIDQAMHATKKTVASRE